MQMVSQVVPEGKTTPDLYISPGGVANLLWWICNIRHHEPHQVFHDLLSLSYHHWLTQRIWIVHEHPVRRVFDVARRAGTCSTECSRDGGEWQIQKDQVATWTLPRHHTHPPTPTPAIVIGENFSPTQAHIHISHPALPLIPTYTRNRYHCYGIDLFRPIHVFISITSLILDRRRYIHTQVLWDRSSNSNTLHFDTPSGRSVSV